MRVKIKKTDKFLGIKKGEIYSATAYWLDPREKVSLLKREPDGFEPNCNQYRSEVEILKNVVPNVEFRGATPTGGASPATKGYASGDKGKGHE